MILACYFTRSQLNATSPIELNKKIYCLPSWYTLFWWPAKNGERLFRSFNTSDYTDWYINIWFQLIPSMQNFFYEIKALENHLVYVVNKKQLGLMLKTTWLMIENRKPFNWCRKDYDVPVMGFERSRPSCSAFSWLDIILSRLWIVGNITPFIERERSGLYNKKKYYLSSRQWMTALFDDLPKRLKNFEPYNPGYNLLRSMQNSVNGIKRSLRKPLDSRF